MSQLSYTTGSEFPPLKNGVVRLYSMRFCPYAHRVRLVLAAKNIPHEIVNINLKKRPEWYSDIHPAGLVPCLQFDDGKIVYESFICCEYLDSVYPQNKLIPSDPYVKARQLMLIENFQRVAALLFKALKFKDPEAFNEICKILDHYEKTLSENFFCGKEPGITDYMIWPWFERFRKLKSLINNELDKKRFPKLSIWIRDMMMKEAVRKASTKEEDMLEFYKLTLKNQELDYDIGLEKPAATSEESDPKPEEAKPAE